MSCMAGRRRWCLQLLQASSPGSDSSQPSVVIDSWPFRHLYQQVKLVSDRERQSLWQMLWRADA